MVEGVDFDIVFEEAEEFDADNTVDEEDEKDEEKEIECFGEDGENGFEDFFGEGDLIKDYSRIMKYV